MEQTLTMAEKEIGQTSDIGGKVNPRVLEYFEKIGATYEPGDDEVWCAAFVGAMLEECGIRSTRALNAKSYLDWGITEGEPHAGDVVVFWRDSIDSSNGHVSFFDHEEEDMYYCLGGNQGSGIVSIEAYPKNRVLGFRSAITTNTPIIMEPTTPTIAENPSVADTAGENIAVTTETKQVLIVHSFTVTYDKSINGEVVDAGATSVLKPTPELMAALALADSTFTEANYNIEEVSA